MKVSMRRRLLLVCLMGLLHGVTGDVERLDDGGTEPEVRVSSKEDEEIKACVDSYNNKREVNEKAMGCLEMVQAVEAGVAQLSEDLKSKMTLNNIRHVVKQHGMKNSLGEVYYDMIIDIDADVLDEGQARSDRQDREDTTYQLIVGVDANKRWKLKDKHELPQSLDVEPLQLLIPEGPFRTSTVNKGIFRPSLLAGLGGGMCIVMLTAAVIAKRAKARKGYTNLAKHAQITQKRKLYRANPVPALEDKSLSRSHEHNERFAV